MTKTIIIGKTNEAPKTKKIQFEYALDGLKDDLSICSTSDSPKEYSYVELICKSYLCGVDLMFAYDDEESRSDGILFVGQWNDGVVE